MLCSNETLPQSSGLSSVFYTELQSCSFCFSTQAGSKITSILLNSAWTQFYSNSGVLESESAAGVTQTLLSLISWCENAIRKLKCLKIKSQYCQQKCFISHKLQPRKCKMFQVTDFDPPIPFVMLFSMLLFWNGFYVFRRIWCYMTAGEIALCFKVVKLFKRERRTWQNMQTKATFGHETHNKDVGSSEAMSWK